MKPNDFFDKVYVINLKESEDRLEGFKKEAERVGLTFQRVEAIHGTDRSVTFNGIENDGWNKNAAALALTTLKILKDAKNNGYKKILIFEDDSFMIPQNFNSIFRRSVRHLPERVKDEEGNESGGWDFFHFNTYDEYPSKWVAPCLIKLAGAWCCQAYGINEQVYDEYIARLEKFDMPIDNMTLLIHKEREMSFATRPSIVSHRIGRYSTLRENVVQY